MFHDNTHCFRWNQEGALEVISDFRRSIFQIEIWTWWRLLTFQNKVYVPTCLCAHMFLWKVVKFVHKLCGQTYLILIFFYYTKYFDISRKKFFCGIIPKQDGINTENQIKKHFNENFINGKRWLRNWRLRKRSLASKPKSKRTLSWLSKRLRIKLKVSTYECLWKKWRRKCPAKLLRSYSVLAAWRIIYKYDKAPLKKINK